MRAPSGGGAAHNLAQPHISEPDVLISVSLTFTVRPGRRAGATSFLYARETHCDGLHVGDYTRGIAMVLVNCRAGEINKIGGGAMLTKRNSRNSCWLLPAHTGPMSTATQTAWGHDLQYSLDISRFASTPATNRWLRSRRVWSSCTWEPTMGRAALNSP